MRLIVNGQQAFGRAALEKILEAGKDEVVGVYTSPDKEGRPTDPVKEAALEHGLPLFQPAIYKDKDVLDQMRALDADLMVMAYMIIFVPEAARSIPKQGSICFHPSLLPLHRGPSSINWPIAMGATKSGLTIFWPDDGLDEGPILMQKECDIGPDETLGDVYFKKLFPMGVDAMLESLDLVKAGTAPRIEQDLSKGSYESWFNKASAQIDWSKPAREIYNIIRAGNPQPGGWTTHNGAELKIFDCRLGDAGGKPGEVVDLSEDGASVAAGEGAIVISRVRGAGAKVPIAEYAAETGLKAGDILGA